MLKKIASILSCKNENSNNSAGDRQSRITVAACVLLLEMARADDDFARSELDRIRELLKNDLDVPPEEIDTILAIAQRKQEEATDLWSYTNLINENFDKTEKQRLIEMIWEIAYSDGRLDQYEDHLVHKIANLLHVPHSDLIAAKLRIKGG
jgi:uncharacterized tellurite resistance protein B-like protein